MSTLQQLARIAQLEFTDVVMDTSLIGVKLRIEIKRRQGGGG
jgi:hypothetical protein